MRGVNSVRFELYYTNRSIYLSSLNAVLQLENVFLTARTTFAIL